MAEPAMIFLFSTCEGRDDTGVVDNIDPPVVGWTFASQSQTVDAHGVNQTSGCMVSNSYRLGLRKELGELEDIV